MSMLLGIAVFCAFLAFFFFFRLLNCLRRRHFVRATTSCCACLVSATIAFAATLFVVSYVGYVRLTAEQIVAQLEFRRINPEEFQARLMVDGENDRFYVLRGDEWQIDARVISWTPPATILGLDPVYQLERLSGRYADIDREQSDVRTVHSLAPASPLDLWAIARRFPALTPGIDAYYGTATYVPVADGARFSVSLSRDALIARPENDRARQALGAWRGN